MNENKTLVARLTFYGFVNDIYLSKVGRFYGLFIKIDDKFERVADTKLRFDRQEAINELVVNYSVPGVYNVELL